jgi:hypothetical protein
MLLIIFIHSFTYLLCPVQATLSFSNSDYLVFSNATLVIDVYQEIPSPDPAEGNGDDDSTRSPPATALLLSSLVTHVRFAYSSSYRYQSTNKPISAGLPSSLPLPPAFHTMMASMTREEFPKLLKALNLYGVGVEVGVRDGDFARVMMQHWQCSRYILVDPWINWEFEEYPGQAPYPSQPLFPSYEICIPF